MIAFRVEKKKKPTEPLPTPSVVPIWQYKTLENESRAKDETIEVSSYIIKSCLEPNNINFMNNDITIIIFLQILQAKINKMDQLLQLKDIRIDELQSSQQKMRQKTKGRGKPGMR